MDNNYKTLCSLILPLFLVICGRRETENENYKRVAAIMCVSYRNRPHNQVLLLLCPMGGGENSVLFDRQAKKIINSFGLLLSHLFRTGKKYITLPCVLTIAYSETSEKRHTLIDAKYT